MTNAVAVSQQVRAVPGYIGRYAVASNGDVWAYPNKSRSVGRWLRKHKTKCGYIYVPLFDGSKRKNVYVHRLVATAWIDPVHGKLHVNHKDGNKENNALSNLEWVTPSENKRHAHQSGITIIKDSQRAASRRNIIEYNRRSAA